MNSEFALALHSLVLLAHDPEKMLKSSEIAKSISVHPVRVRKNLSLLKKSGYIDSKEGIKGGFTFNYNPQKITLDEIYCLTLKDVLKPKCHSCCQTRCKVGANIEDVLTEIFTEADLKLQDFLKKTNLQMLLDRCCKS